MGSGDWLYEASALEGEDDTVALSMIPVGSAGQKVENRVYLEDQRDILKHQPSRRFGRCYT